MMYWLFSSTALIVVLFIAAFFVAFAIAWLIGGRS